jgi:predicted small integral membrane protein
VNNFRVPFKAGPLIRIAKAALVFSVGLFALLAGVGNLIDPAPNLEFVVHVLSMDTVFSPVRSAWRAITNPVVHGTAFWLIVAMELVVAALCLWGSARLGSSPTSAHRQRDSTRRRGRQLPASRWGSSSGSPASSPSAASGF